MVLSVTAVDGNSLSLSSLFISSTASSKKNNKVVFSTAAVVALESSKKNKKSQKRKNAGILRMECQNLVQVDILVIFCMYKTSFLLIKFFLVKKRFYEAVINK
jgi:hypothetical protein